MLQALAGELDGSRRLTVHVVDPYPCGAGRIWRADQPG
ncbi:MAG: FAD/NAD(P)-binding protein, partial [Corynebacterium sp.]|nr:FAD/NAD(P)-binding protein [Corynebacterium sp.]